MDAICEEGGIVSKNNKEVIAKDGTIYAIVLPNLESLKGEWADQIILDYAFTTHLHGIIRDILCNSCVPSGFQVIDDRKILGQGSMKTGYY